ncbi:unnamed protein product, partial [Gongylonema pulchrum]|uniref:SH3 domain-containing protein n=1 Tax=Gongylonema pulchrum TaxID=637853 RepID=A0A183DJ87_9BILA
HTNAAASPKVDTTKTATTQQSRPGATGNSVTNEWTAQLKNDLGIGSSAATKTSTAQSTVVVPKSPLQNVKTTQAGAAAPPARQSRTVEFVSGDPTGPSLPEYQFEFNGDESVDHAEDVYASSAKSHTINSHPSPAKIEVSADSSSSMLSNGPMADYSATINSQPPPAPPKARFFGRTPRRKSVKLLNFF